MFSNPSKMDNWFSAREILLVDKLVTMIKQASYAK